MRMHVHLPVPERANMKFEKEAVQNGPVVIEYWKWKKMGKKEQLSTCALNNPFITAHEERLKEIGDYRGVRAPGIVQTLYQPGVA